MRTSSDPVWAPGLTRGIALGATLWCVLCNNAGAAPPRVQLNEDELARLRAGEVVVRASVGDSGAESTGIALVRAEPAKIWEEVFDYGARVPESPNLVSAAEYGRLSRWDWGVAMSVSVVGLGGDLNLRLHWDEPGSWATFTLDTTRENVVAATEGWYRVEPLDDGYMLTYSTLTKTKFYVPGFVQRTVAERDMADIMGYLRARSEGKKE